MRARIVARGLRLAAAAALALVPSAFAAALEAEVSLDLLTTAALRQQGGSSVQAEATRLLGQAVLSHKQDLAEGLSLSGTFWAGEDSLPSGNPLDAPEGKLLLSSRFLELGLAWEPLPGQLVVELGKKIIHPSSGFFKAPLNLLSRGSASGLAPSSGAAAGKWEEGWAGVDVTCLVGDLTVANFFSPRLRWSDSADESLRYLSRQQEECDDLVRIGLRLGNADLRVLALTSFLGVGDAESEAHLKLGAGADASLGDSLTLRAEVSAADSRDRLEAVDEGTLSTAERSLAWAPRALAGLTWAGPNDLSVMVEYYYNGLGFAGSDYDRLLRYSENRLAAPGSPGPDIIGQFGSFEAARNYLFVRASGKLEDDLVPALFNVLNLQDLSGMTGASLAYTRESWALSASAVDYWGGARSEAGLFPALWQLDLQMSLFF